RGKATTGNRRFVVAFQADPLRAAEAVAGRGLGANQLRGLPQGCEGGAPELRSPEVRDERTGVGAASRAAPSTRVPLGSRHPAPGCRSARGTYPRIRARR